MWLNLFQLRVNSRTALEHAIGVERLDPKPLNARAIELKRVEVNSRHLSTISSRLRSMPWIKFRWPALFRFILVSLLLFGVLGVTRAATPPPKRPNILFIMADD